MSKEFRYELFSQMINEFADNEVKPVAAETDEYERFPEENVKRWPNWGFSA